MASKKRTHKSKKAEAKKSLLPAAAPEENDNFILNILAYIFRLLFVCDVSICLSPITFILAMSLRFSLLHFYEGSCFKEFIEVWLGKGVTDVKTNFTDSLFDGITFGGLVKSLFLYLPYYLFFLWWYLTSIMLFITGIYSGCGTRNMGSEGEYSELRKFEDYLNNRQRFMGYEDFLDYLRRDRSNK